MADSGSSRRDIAVALVSGLLAAAITTALLALPALARPAAVHGVKNPSHNRRLTQATVTACDSSPNGAACTRLALADINAARKSEGVGPMRLPRHFSSLTGPEQLMALSNLERIGRGLPPILGLTARLDRDARAGALRRTDPSPTHFYGVAHAYSANFEYGYSSTLESDFAWMYDDGYGSFNYDCPYPHALGCWGHRKDILLQYAPPIVMGAAVTHANGATEMTELFLFGDRETGPGQPDHPLAPTWRTISH
jgi:hypothetical protein